MARNSFPLVHITLLVIVTTCIMARGQNLPNSNAEWIRVESPSKDFSVEVPSNSLLVDNEDSVSRVWYFETGLSVSLYMEKRGDAKAVVRRWAARDRERYKSFESGNFFIRQLTDPDKDGEKRLWLNMGSQGGLYQLYVSDKKVHHGTLERIRNSIELSGQPLFQTGLPAPALQKVPIKSLKTSPVILEALKRPDSRLAGYRIAPKGTKYPPDDREFSRPLLILRRTSAENEPAERTNRARDTVRLRVQFLGSGEIGDIHLLESLQRTRDESAFKAARKIKFVPAEIDGKPVDVWRTFEYYFPIS